MSRRCYVDNPQNRALGRVGMPHGSAVHSRSSGSSTSCSTRVYVDNAQNRALGRVGMPHGSAVHSRSSGSSTSCSTGVYVDNAQNRALGRVGMPYGSAVQSSSGTSSLNRQLGGMQIKRCYVDNAYNRRLGRVGMPIGSMVVSKTTSNAGNSGVKTYVDNAYNRRVGRVGKPLGSCVISKLKCDPKVFDINRNICDYEEYDAYNELKDYVREEMKCLRNLIDARNSARNSGTIGNDLPPQQIIEFGELELGDQIGGGGFGDVHVAFYRGKQVAVKKLRVQRVHQSKKKQFEDEVRNLAALNHPNIVKFYGACIVTPNLALVMEFLGDGSLYDNLYYSEPQFDDETKNQFICDCFSALRYIHSKQMVHRDIKSRNVMLYNNKTRCKLADFGLALKDETETNSVTKHFNFAGTEKYCPKELIEGKRLTISELMLVDVYSLALTSFELLSEKEPFDDCKNIFEVRRAITDGEILKTLEKKDYGISTAKKNLLRSALSAPQNRPSAADFLARFNQIK